MIRTEVNAGDFLKSILHVGDFPRQFKYGQYIINAGDSPTLLNFLPYSVLKKYLMVKVLVSKLVFSYFYILFVSVT